MDSELSPDVEDLKHMISIDPKRKLFKSRLSPQIKSGSVYHKQKVAMYQMYSREVEGARDRRHIMHDFLDS